MTGLLMSNTYTEDDTYLSVYGGEYGGLAFVILISAATEDELFDGMLLDVTNTIRPCEIDDSPVSGGKEEKSAESKKKCQLSPPHGCVRRL